jgi:hypothetical protein
MDVIPQSDKPNRLNGTILQADKKAIHDRVQTEYQRDQRRWPDEQQPDYSVAQEVTSWLNGRVFSTDGWHTQNCHNQSSCPIVVGVRSFITDSV